MKNSIFKSFRFEIVLYSLLSLIYTILTEAALFFGIYLIYNIIHNDGVREKVLNSESIRNGATNSLPYVNQQIPGYGAAVDSGRQAMDSINDMVPVLVTLALTIGVILFTAYFLLLTKKFVVYLERISWGIQEISAGNFKTRINIDSEDEFTLIADKINQMAADVNQIFEDNRKSEHAKNELITSVAHDLRTPLTSIIGYLDLVSAGKNIDDEVKQKYVEVAYSKSKRLEKLIEDLFAYTNVSFGEVAMDYTEVDMVKFMNQLVDEFYPSFQDSGLEYEFTTNVNSAIVMADGNQLSRAIANLISNAIKYGKDGKRIKIKLWKENGKVIVDIINYGRLIPEEDIENIFKRFYRVESSRSSETGGTGLGLAIAKSIIEMHGGTVRARSNFDGTVFEVTLDEKFYKE
ncbi:sensor histidine kinase [Anaerocolumna sp.]|uniref:sensor histidine kinase n=1 Tax=Anaerocolumna sp. TaxID=2041569 RepID=UPI0028AF4C3B|nr:HAMP domain-containing sensor histidine kinase [Anaerocolumna sp.]